MVVVVAAAAMTAAKGARCVSQYVCRFMSIHIESPIICEYPRFSTHIEPKDDDDVGH